MMQQPKTRIFVVEDEALIAMEIRDRLVGLGYEIAGSAASGEQALARILATEVDLVLMDVNLAGELDGIETVRRLHQSRQTPVIFLTAYSDEELLERAEGVAPFGYLVKPFEERELHATIKMTLRRARVESELQEANERLAASERIFSSLAKASPVGIYRADETGSIVYVNRRWCQLTGLSEEASLGAGWARAVHPNDRERVLGEWSACLVDGLTFESEFRFVGSQGRITWVLGAAAEIRAADHSITGYMGTLTDISEQKRLEDSARTLASEFVKLEGQEYFEAIVLHLAEQLDVEMAFVTRRDLDRPGDLRTLAIVAGGALCPNLRYSVIDTPCAHVIDGRALVVPTGLQAMFPKDTFLVENSVDSYAGEPLIGPNGLVLGHVGVTSTSPLRSPHSVRTMLEVFAVSISAVIEREQEQARYRGLFDFAPVGLVMCDPLGLIRMVNRQAERIFGWSRDEMLAQPVEMLIPKDHQEAYHSSRAGFLSQPTHRDSSERPTLVGVRKDGQQFPVEVDIAPVETVSGPLIAAGIRDISARKKLEQQVSRANKMEALGKLTGGLAHDFNNHLAVILGNLNLVARGLEQGSEDARRLETARKGAQSAAALTESLLAFSSRRPFKPEAISATERIEQLATFLGRALGEDIELLIQTDGSPSPVMVDASIFESCIVNLATNARAAMPAGGALTITTRCAGPQGYSADRSEPGPCRERVLIEVSDTGTGMSEDVQRMAFEPFFTTKKEGHGTGLGLSMVYSFMQQAGGSVEIDSQLDRGTTVRLFFPRHEGPLVAPSVRQEPAPTAAPSLEGKVILVVDDNELTRETACEVLLELGCQSIGAEGPDAALKILAQDDQPIDLLFTDIIMPGEVGGFELARMAQELRPGLAVLGTSGYPGDLVLGGGAQVALLRKPYDEHELERSIRASLDSATVGKTEKTP